MLFVISPAKKLDEDVKVAGVVPTRPALLEEAQVLVKVLRGYDVSALQALMGVSEKIAMLNVQRYQHFRVPFTSENAAPALYMFRGDVYQAMRVQAYTDDDLVYAQEHLRILSGLYGVLRPLDLMQPYRLEMGARLETSRGKDLYAFWGDRLAKHVQEVAGNDAIVNLASKEYIAAVDRSVLTSPVLDVVFKERKGDALKVIGLMAKRARGMMVDYAIRHRLERVEQLKDFTEGGYAFEPGLSTESCFTFVR